MLQSALSLGLLYCKGFLIQLKVANIDTLRGILAQGHCLGGIHGRQLEYSYYFPNAFFTSSRASLILIFIYYRYKFIIETTFEIAFIDFEISILPRTDFLYNEASLCNYLVALINE